MSVFIGTSGWQYTDWRGRFYPQDLPQRLWLEHYSENFRTVEVNNTFYRLPDRKVFEQWKLKTPPDFIMTLKISRYLTHVKRLADPAEPITRFLEYALPLGKRMGPVLMQLPPAFEADIDRLDEALSRFPAGTRVAVEFRNPSWFTHQTRGVLERHQAAWCLADRKQSPLGPLWRTADWGYLRLHEGAGQPHPCYERHTLSNWARTIAREFGSESDVFVYFNNDHLCCAVKDAATFAELVSDAGLDPTRVRASQSYA